MLQTPCHHGEKSQHTKRIERSGKPGTVATWDHPSFHLWKAGKSSRMWASFFLFELTTFLSDTSHTPDLAVFELCFIFMFLFIAMIKMADRNYLQEDQYPLAHSVRGIESLMEKDKTQWLHWWQWEWGSSLFTQWQTESRETYTRTRGICDLLKPQGPTSASQDSLLKSSMAFKTEWELNVQNMALWETFHIKIITDKVL